MTFDALWQQLPVPLVVGVIGSALTWAGIRYGRRGSREIAMIERLEASQARADEKIEELERNLEVVRREMQTLILRDGLWQVHAERLEGQLRELDEEPHPRPAALMVAAPAKETP